MDKENKYHSRTGFLKKFPLALAAVFGIGLTGFNFQKIQQFLGNSFKTLSGSEANHHIRKMAASETNQIKPEPPPKIQQTSDGL